MFPLASALVALAAVAGSAATQPRLHESDVTSMVQQLLSVENPKSPQPHAQFSVGDHVFVQLDPKGASTSSMVKGSIAAVGSVKNTYDVHLWFGAPRKRELRGVPAELLTDASPVEAVEAAQQKAAEKAEAEKQHRLEEEQRRREEQQRSLEDMKRRAEEEERENAEEEARLQREMGERREQEAALAKVQELIEEEQAKKKAAEQQKKAAEQLVDRKAALKAKWESVKVARLKKAGAEHAPLEVQKMILRGDNFRAQTSEKAAVSQQGTESKAAFNATHVHFRVMDLQHKTDVPFTVARTFPLKAMMAKACERLGTIPGHGLFFSGRRKVHPEDSADTLGLKDGDVLTVMIKKKRVKY